MNRQSYEGSMEEKLGELGRSIDVLSHEAELTARDAKQNVSANIQALREQRDNLAGDLEHLKHSTGKAWDDIQTSMDAAWSDVQKMLQKASSRFQ